MQQSQPRCRLALVVDEGAGLPGDADLRQALAAGDVAALIIRPAGRDGSGIARLRRFTGAAQARNVAVLVANDVELARGIGADGIHLDLDALEDDDAALARYHAARAALGAQASIGAAAGLSRHLAMELGEAGADYVAFGPAEGADRDRLLELIDWWAEVVEVPVLALVTGEGMIEQAAMISDAGADFVAVTVGVGDDLAATVARLAETIGTAKAG